MIRFFPLCLLAVLAGCSGADSTGATLSGSVMLDGKPLDRGLITFTPVGNSGSSAFAQIDEEGKYSAKMSRSLVGIAPGEYKVGIAAWEVEPGSWMPDGSIVEEGVPITPKKYHDPEQSGIVVQVSPESENVEDFTLVSE